jgi:hypothetical protein
MVGTPSTDEFMHVNPVRIHATAPSDGLSPGELCPSFGASGKGPRVNLCVRDRHFAIHGTLKAEYVLRELHGLNPLGGRAH